MKITEKYLSFLKYKFEKRLHGTCPVPRNRFLLIKNKDLTQSEYILYCLICDVIADWDDRHDTFGLFEVDFDILSLFTSWSTSKLRRLFKSLCIKNFLIFVADKKYSVNGIELRKRYYKKEEEFNYYLELKDIVGF